MERIPRASGLDDGDEPTAGWDVGEHPTSQMAHIFYPHEDAHFAHARSEDALALSPAWATAEAKHGLLDRQRVRKETGWASDLHKEYKPLGPPLELPALGAQLRKKRSGTTQYRKPQIVLPREEEEKREQAKMVYHKPLQAGVPLLEEFVRQFERNYYAFELRERKVLVLTLEPQSGDPDVFVSSESKTPSQDVHTWKSAGLGDDVVTIAPDHPRYACPCTYYISVWAAQDAEYSLSVQLQDEPLHLNLHVPPHVPDGFGVLTALVSDAEGRREATRFRPQGTHDRPPGLSSLPPQLLEALQAPSPLLSAPISARSRPDLDPISAGGHLEAAQEQRDGAAGGAAGRRRGGAKALPHGRLAGEPTRHASTTSTSTSTSTSSSSCRRFTTHPPPPLPPPPPLARPRLRCCSRRASVGRPSRPASPPPPPTPRRAPVRPYLPPLQPGASSTPRPCPRQRTRRLSSPPLICAARRPSLCAAGLGTSPSRAPAGTTPCRLPCLRTAPDRPPWAV